MATFRSAAQQAALRKAQKAALLKALRAHPNGIPMRKADGKARSTPGFGAPVKKARDVPYIGSMVGK